MVWVTYGVAQKVLLRRLASPQILVLLYTLCAIALFPLAKPAVIFQLSGWQLACLLFCGANTLIGYGALAEAMARWQAAGECVNHADSPVYPAVFRFIGAGLATGIYGPGIECRWLCRCFCGGCRCHVFRNWSPLVAATAETSLVASLKRPGE